jgi:predicted CoA-binding protein
VNVAIVGASNSRHKYGNRAVRAYAARGFDVYPVNDHEETIEGLAAFARVSDIPVELDRVSVYLPPEKTFEILDDIAAKGVKELFLNPGSESPEVMEKAQSLGLEPIAACSIIDIGESPASY